MLRPAELITRDSVGSDTSQRSLFTPTLLFLVLLLVTILVRLAAICSGAELTFDEAYYWHWSRHLDWCYFSKGPAVAAIIRLTTSWLGDTELGVRAGSLAASTIMLATFYFWSRDFLRCSRSALVAILLVLAAPLLGGMGMVMTIDSPLLLCWTIAMAATWYSLESRGILGWIVVGLAMAAGVQCKFTMLLFLPALALGAATHPSARAHLKWRGPALAVGVTAISMLPVLIWNIRNGWITLQHTVDKATVVKNDPFLTLKHMLPSVGTQLGVMSPLIGAGMAIGAAMLLRDSIGATRPDGLERSRARFLLSMAIPPGLFYAALSFHRMVEGNWMAVVFLPLLVAAAYYWQRPGTRFQRWSLAAAIGLGVIIQAPLFVGDSLYTLRLPRIFGAMGIPFQPSWDLTNRVHGWRPMVEEAVRLGKEIEARTGRPTYYIANHYSLASFIGFYGHVPDRVMVTPHEEIANQFDYWGTQGRWPPMDSNAVQVRDIHKGYFSACDLFESAENRVRALTVYRKDFAIRKYEFDVLRGLREPYPRESLMDELSGQTLTNSRQ